MSAHRLSIKMTGRETCHEVDPRLHLDFSPPKQIEQKIEDMFASRKRVTDVTKPVPGQLNNPVMPNFPGLPPQMMPGIFGAMPQFGFGPIPAQGPPQAGGKLELARRLAAKINMQRNLGPDAQVSGWISVC